MRNDQEVHASIFCNTKCNQRFRLLRLRTIFLGIALFCGMVLGCIYTYAIFLTSEGYFLKVDIRHFIGNKQTKTEINVTHLRNWNTVKVDKVIHEHVGVSLKSKKTQKDTLSCLEREIRKLMKKNYKPQNSSGVDEVQDYARRLCNNDPKARCRIDETDTHSTNHNSTLYNRASNEIQIGGWWRPKSCLSERDVAIIVPYRNRRKHLNTFLNHLHPFLQKQKLHYRILVIDQVDNSPFNRGKLLNVGYREAQRFFPYSCYVFHDVDLLPEDIRNLYDCNVSPQHMTVSLDKHEYKLLYNELFGGVEMFSDRHFKRVNGFSNSFWGWGAEDDNMYRRVHRYGLHVWRQSVHTGRYQMLKHVDQEANGIPNRNAILKLSEKYFRTDGLSSLQYEVIEYRIEKLYTLVRVDLRKVRDKLFGKFNFSRLDQLLKTDFKAKK